MSAQIVPPKEGAIFRQDGTVLEQNVNDLNQDGDVFNQDGVSLEQECGESDPQSPNDITTTYNSKPESPELQDFKNLKISNVSTPVHSIKDIPDISRRDLSNDTNLSQDINDINPRKISSSAPNPTVFLEPQRNLLQPIHDRTIIGDMSEYSDSSQLDPNVTVFDENKDIGRQYNRSVSEPPVRPTLLEGNQEMSTKEGGRGGADAVIIPTIFCSNPGSYQNLAQTPRNPILSITLPEPRGIQSLA